MEKMIKNTKKVNIHSLNVITNVIQQVVVIISGIIIPKIILTFFGSEVNGLVSSINQLLSYITLLEGGVSSVILASLYKPLINHEENKISSILKTSKSFYLKIAGFYIAYSLIIGIIYPIFLQKKFSFFYILSLTIILSLGLLIQYTMAITLRTLLTADNKVYVVSITQIIVSLSSIILVVISVKIYPSIHLLKFVTALPYLVQSIIFTYYVKTHYKIAKNAPTDNSLIKSRWDGFAINIAAFVHYSTDIVVLTLFTNLSVVSIYSVYALVSNGLKSVISAVSGAISPSLGKAYASGDTKTTIQVMRVYEFVMNFCIMFLFSVAALLIIPFIKMYTNNISDADYIQPLFAYILLLSEAVYLIKEPHTSLAYSANKFKELKTPCFLETGINIVLSVFLVKLFGLVGVAIGTLIAMIYRAIFQVWYTKKILPDYSISSYIVRLVIMLVATCVGGMLATFLVPKCAMSWFSWIIHGIIFSAIEIIFLTVANVVFDKKIVLATYKFFIK